MRPTPRSASRTWTRCSTCSACPVTRSRPRTRRPDSGVSARSPVPVSGGARAPAGPGSSTSGVHRRAALDPALPRLGVELAIGRAAGPRGERSPPGRDEEMSLVEVLLLLRASPQRARSWLKIDRTCPGPPVAGEPPLGRRWFVAGDEPQQRLPRPPRQDAQDRAPGDPGDLLDLVDADPSCGGLADDLVPPGLGLGPAAQLVLRV